MQTAATSLTTSGSILPEPNTKPRVQCESKHGRGHRCAVQRNKSCQPHSALTFVLALFLTIIPAAPDVIVRVCDRQNAALATQFLCFSPSVCGCVCVRFPELGFPDNTTTSHIVGFAASQPQAVRVHLVAWYRCRCERLSLARCAWLPFYSAALHRFLTYRSRPLVLGQRLQNIRPGSKRLSTRPRQ